MEASALTRQRSRGGLRAPGPMLRVQSDERLIALTRRGNHAAFEVLCSRYHARLLAFCRHMLGSKEDAEDILQEVFAAAFNAVLADEREINAKPWLYKIARNRSLNHLRRASAVGVDSMDVHYAEHGVTTSDKVMRRESFRELIGDVHDLPESQRTALLLREIDDLSYEQIAITMETTVPSVKSLLVRARMSLAEAAEARKLSCEEVRLELGEAAEGLGKPSAAARRHTRECERCQGFKRTLRDNNKALAALLPIAPALALKQLLLGKIGSTSAGHAAGGAGAGASAASGSMASGGLMTASIGAVATKAAAGIAAAALVTAGAVAVTHTAVPQADHAAAPSTPAAVTPIASTIGVSHVRTVFHRLPPRPARHAAARSAAAATTVKPAVPTPPAPATSSHVTEVTTEQSVLPKSSTEASAQGASATPPPATGAPIATSTPPAASEVTGEGLGSEEAAQSDGEGTSTGTTGEQGTKTPPSEEKSTPPSEEQPQATTTAPAE